MLGPAIARTEEHIRNSTAPDQSSHDWWHIWRVRNLALRLAREEGIVEGLGVVELAALLHDIADWKYAGGDETAGPRAARAWLEGLRAERLKVDAAVVDHVCDIIDRLSFKGAGVPTPMPTLEGKVVQDADRLDAIGAIGVARAFAYGGERGQALYDPELAPRLHGSFAEYKSAGARSSVINHFHEKLVLLRDRLQTDSARRLAESRHAFLLAFLEQFQREWGAES